MSNSINKMALSYIVSNRNDELRPQPETVSTKNSVQQHPIAPRGAEHQAAMSSKIRKNLPLAHIAASGEQNPAIQKRKNTETKLEKASALFNNADRSDSTVRRLIMLYCQGFREYEQGQQSYEPKEISQALECLADLVLRSGDVNLAIKLLNASLEIDLNHVLKSGLAASDNSVMQDGLKLLAFASSASRNSGSREFGLR